MDIGSSLSGNGVFFRVSMCGGEFPFHIFWQETVAVSYSDDVCRPVQDRLPFPASQKLDERSAGRRQSPGARKWQRFWFGRSDLLHYHHMLREAACAITYPNGPMYYSGVYHLFYQYNPYNYTWGNIIWAHSVSTDLVNWKAVKPAIKPSGPFDINGCWSGSATVLPGNHPVIFYTGSDNQNRQVQNIAFPFFLRKKNIAFPKNLSDPYLVAWVKPSYNPVIIPDGEINASQFRDPTTIWRGLDGHWRLLVGSVVETRGMALLYRSRDLVHWVKAEHPLHSTNDSGMWECPDFYPVAVKGNHGLDTSANGVGIKHVLKASLGGAFDYYTVGTYNQELDRYMPDDGTGLLYDYGNFYASKSFFDPKKNRRILWGWVQEADSVEDDAAKGWAGIQSIPRKLWLDDDGRQLVQWPVEELETLRGEKAQVANHILKSGHLLEVKGILTEKADVEVTFAVPNLEKAEPFDPSWTDPQLICNQEGGGAKVKGGIGPFGLYVLASGNMEERTAVFFRIFKGKHKPVVLMCHDPSSSSIRPSLHRPSYGGFVDYDITKNQTISLRSLVDVSVVESFGAGGRTVMTSRVYPTMAMDGNAHLYLFNNGDEDIKILNLTAWEMKKPLMNEEQL